MAQNIINQPIVENLNIHLHFSVNLKNETIESLAQKACGGVAKTEEPTVGKENIDYPAYAVPDVVRNEERALADTKNKNECSETFDKEVDEQELEVTINGKTVVISKFDILQFLDGETLKKLFVNALQR